MFCAFMAFCFFPEVACVILLRLFYERLLFDRVIDRAVFVPLKRVNARLFTPVKAVLLNFKVSMCKSGRSYVAYVMP